MRMISKKILSMLLTIVILVIAALSLAGVSFADSYVAVIKGTSVNIRSGPGTTYAILGQGNTGDTFPLVSTTPQSNFYEITYKGATAYVSATYASVSAVSSANYTATIQGTSVNVRSGPGTSYSILGQVNTGDIFPLLSTTQENGFYKISYKNGIGYVSAQYAKASANGTTSPVTGMGKYIQMRFYSSTMTENIRSAPDPSSTILGTLKQGQTMELMENKTYSITKSGVIYKYFKVVYNGRVAYVYTRYADMVSTFAKAPNYSQYTNYVRVKASVLNVRSGPGTSYPIIGTTELSDILPLKSTAITFNFYMVEYNGQTAYISADYAERISPTAKPSLSATWIAVVNIKNQTVSVYQSGKLVRFMSCSTGATSTPTPTGTYTVQYRIELFLSGDRSELSCFDAVNIVGGIYFHRIPRLDDATYSGFKEALGQKASHGCIRLPEVHSRWMYASFPNGGTVVIGNY